MGTLTVHVVAMADAPAIGVVHGETRTRQLTVTPAAANADVTLTHVEYLPTLVQSVTPATGGVDLVIKGAHTGAVKIVARITSATGPILRSYETHAFDMRIVTRKNTPMFKEYNDGDWLTGSAVQMQPHFDGHEVKLRALGGGVSFEATGNDIYWVDTGAFDANSQYPFYLITGGGLTGCHATAEVREQGE